MEKILIVDDHEQNCALMNDILTNWGYQVYMAYHGKEAIDITLKKKPEVILLDVMLPGMNGFEVCTELKKNPETENIPVIMLSVLNDVEDHIRGYKVGADIFMSKPIHYNELRYKLSSLVKQKKALAQMEGQKQVVLALLEIMKARGPHLYLHASKVQEYCCKVARFLFLSEEQQSQLFIGAYLHDIGKVVTGFSEEHVLVGETLIKPLKMSSWLTHYIRGHHEKLNGQGYPDCLAGEEIPLELRILAGVNRFIELWEERNSKEQALTVFLDEVKEGFWELDVGKALKQVWEDEKFIDKLIIKK